MLTEPQKKWVEALRSGEYRQVQGELKRKLHNGFGYCCLGVACELAAQEGIIPQSPKYEGEGRDELLSGDLLEVKEWLGLRDGMGEFQIHDTTSSLAQLNDDYITFEEIAQVIESQPPGLFARPRGIERR